MTNKSDTLWDNFLKPIFQILINPEEIKTLNSRLDWDNGLKELSNQNIIYPEYYLKGDFHGIKNGYLTRDAATTYDAITRYVLPPSELWLREELIKMIAVTPSKVLDVGCGTGLTTIMLQEKFPAAQVNGLDLSPYMLLAAQDKAKISNLPINWLHGDAQSISLPSESLDLITITLLFHETPTDTTKEILRECFRLLKNGGQIIIVDGNQKSLREVDWLTNVFHEPYIKEYGRGNIDDWLELTGFKRIETKEFWFIHQITTAFKPIMVNIDQISVDEDTDIKYKLAF